MPTNIVTQLYSYEKSYLAEEKLYSEHDVFLRNELPWLGNSRLPRKQRFSATDFSDDISTSETGIIFDGRTHGETLRKHNASPLTCVNFSYHRLIFLWLKKTCALPPNKLSFVRLNSRASVLIFSLLLEQPKFLID